MNAGVRLLGFVACVTLSLVAIAVVVVVVLEAIVSLP